MFKNLPCRIPHLYLQTDFSQTKIKPPFDNPSIFLSHSLDKSLLSLYSRLELPDRATCVLFTWVIADGWGDLFAQLEAARVLSRHLPQLNLILFSLIHKDRIPPLIEHSFLEHRLLYTGNLNEPPICQAPSESQWSDLNHADLILEMPTAFPFMTHWINSLKEPKPSYERLGEHSLIETPLYSPIHLYRNNLKHRNFGKEGSQNLHSEQATIAKWQGASENANFEINPTQPKTDSSNCFGINLNQISPPSTRCMGLHFLEKGIFIKTHSTYSWSDLASHPLLLLLFQTHCPSREQILEYQRSHAFQLNYTKTYRGLYLYLSALFSGLSEDSRSIDIASFDLPLFIHVLEKKFKKEENYPLLKQWNIGQLILYYRGTQTLITISPHGKQVRLIYCESLAHHQLMTLMHLTDHLIGATGDQSVLEAIATKKPFFYDPPPFKRSFLKDLAFIAKHHLSNRATLTRFFDLCLKEPALPIEEDHRGWVSEDYVEKMEAYLSLEEDTDEKIGSALGQLLLNPSLSDDFVALQEHLAMHHDLGPLLVGMVVRGIIHHRHPDLSAWEADFCARSSDISSSRNICLASTFEGRK